MLRHLSYCSTLNQEDRRTLDEEIQMYSSEIDTCYEQPLRALGESTLYDDWLNKLTIPALRDCEGICDVIHACIVRERERKTLTLLRQGRLRIGLDVRKWRIAQIKKPLMHEFLSFKSAMFVKLYDMNVKCPAYDDDDDDIQSCSSIVQVIFSFWSFEISKDILRNQKFIIG